MDSPVAGLLRRSSARSRTRFSKRRTGARFTKEQMAVLTGQAKVGGGWNFIAKPRADGSAMWRGQTIERDAWNRIQDYAEQHQVLDLNHENRNLGHGARQGIVRSPGTEDTRALIVADWRSISQRIESMCALPVEAPPDYGLARCCTVYIGQGGVHQVAV